MRYLHADDFPDWLPFDISIPFKFALFELRILRLLAYSKPIVGFISDAAGRNVVLGVRKIRSSRADL
jgi:hypothetical protein